MLAARARGAAICRGDDGGRACSGNRGVPGSGCCACERALAPAPAAQEAARRSRAALRGVGERAARGLRALAPASRSPAAKQRSEQRLAPGLGVVLVVRGKSRTLAHWDRPAPSHQAEGHVSRVQVRHGGLR